MKRIYLLIALIVTLSLGNAVAQCPILCDSVATLNYSVQGVNSISLEWTAPVPADTGYQVMYRQQNSGNPFVTATKNKHPWINEIRYFANTAQEGYEIIGPKGLLLDCYQIWIYKSVDTITPSQIIDLSGTLPGAASDFYFGTKWYDKTFGSSGAVALIYNADSCGCYGTTQTAHYIKFGTSLLPKPTVFNVAPTDITTGLGTPTLNESVALVGMGDVIVNFSWQFTSDMTDDAINTGQQVVSSLSGSLNEVDFEGLSPCTAYEFKMRPITNCKKSSGQCSSFGEWKTAFNAVTGNSISQGSLLDPGGNSCPNITICTGDNPNFDCIAHFNDNNNNPDSCISATYLITENNIIVGYFDSPSLLKAAIPGLNEGIYEINAVGHNLPISNNAIGNNISSIISDGCINFLFSTVSLEVYDIPTIVSSQITDPTTCNGTDGQVMVTTNAGIGTHEYRLLPVVTGWQSSPQFTGLGALTNYILQIRVVEAPFCILSDTFDLVDPGTPTVNITATTIACKGGTSFLDLTVSGGTGPFNYLWSTLEVVEDITVIAGTYSVTVSNATNCPVVSSITVNEPATLLNTLIQNIKDELCYGQSNGEAVVSGGGGVSPYSYIWSDGQMTEHATGLAAGVYTFTVTDSNGCSKTNSVNINGAAQFYFDTVVTDSVDCFGECDATISATALGGNAPYTYHWSNNQFGTTISNVCAGSYTISVTDASGCVIIDSVVVYQRPELTDSLFFKTPICRGDSNGTASVIISGGTPPYTYNWLPNQSVNGPSISSLPSGTYGYNVFDSKGCMLDATFFIPEPIPVVATIMGDSIICESDSTWLDAIVAGSNCTSFSYDWGIGQSASIYVSPIADNTVYSLTVTDCNGCVAESSFTMDIEEYPRISTVPSQDTIVVTVDDGDPFSINLDDYFDQDANYNWFADYVSDLIDTDDKDSIGSTPNELTDQFVLIANEFNVVRVVTYQVDAYSQNGNCLGESLIIIINLNPFGELVEEIFADIITPNGDGKNDQFLVRYTDEAKQDAVIRIYNRSGAQVYEGIVGETDNSWDGTYNNTGEKLPDGTYWYTISDGNTILNKGAVTMIGSN